jgi:hypothetical protein
MTDTRFAGRCDALYRADARPVLAAVAAARVAGRPIPVADWQCTRPPHVGTELPLHDQHLVRPLGPTGPDFRFGPELVEPDAPAAPECSNLACQHSQTDHDADGNCTLCPCLADPLGPELPFPDDHQPAGPLVAATALAELVDQLARRGAGVVRCEPGDTLLVLVPELDAEVDADQPEESSPARRYAEMLGGLLPGVAVLVLAGVAGAVVVPAPAGD